MKRDAQVRSLTSSLERRTSNLKDSTALLGGHELLADRAQDALIGERGQVDQVLAILVAVENDHEAVDPKRHRPPQESILGGEVVFAEVGDGIEELAVADVERPIGVE